MICQVGKIRKAEVLPLLFLILFGFFNLLLDAVKLLVHLKKLFLGEANVCHAQHAGKTENRESAHHFHNAAVGLDLDGESAGLLFALGLALWLKYEDGKKGYGLEKPNITK